MQKGLLDEIRSKMLELEASAESDERNRSSGESVAEWLGLRSGDELENALMEEAMRVVRMAHQAGVNYEMPVTDVNVAVLGLAQGVAFACAAAEVMHLEDS